MMKNKGKFDKAELSKFGIDLDGKSSARRFNANESSVDYGSGGGATPDLKQIDNKISIKNDYDEDCFNMTQPKIDVKKGSLPLVIGSEGQRNNAHIARTPQGTQSRTIDGQQRHFADLVSTQVDVQNKTQDSPQGYGDDEFE